uniref:Peroxisomal biogenesis factor 11 n=1 Tax=Lotharella oceanica TaxID=641309 RepID=A0A7S2TY97_9EUKA|mmetsp:Transcript_32651/g.60716  ORF Transcript_32651/g.60716 Transcript_32651/m.60716 type:complete len:217 (+) Transcript_32651:91-741(+)|eukprot:CAMPEP_0170177588 /NCGR_PEP_ID=MMETSP0040_2-20121228/10550_1 /TAXON_ID=641309 /ORGANISM="Lotharella oceanica, Strain CCMP622" /LENGTH=216 /DNA_ID=CAMNT_0010420273 /DNA_START=88 /DNA_END=738 /DNA_ORIENTATION=-
MSMPAWEVALNTYWVKYASKISARDKMYRFAQYFSRMVYFQMEQSGAPKEAVAWVKHISKTASTGRKFIRLGKFIDIWYKAYKHLAKHSLSLTSEKDLINCLGIMALVADMIFYVWDFLRWFEEAKVFQFNMNVKYKRTLWNGIRYAIKAVRYTLLLRTTKEGSKAFYSHRRLAIKSALDFLNPMKGLKYNSLNDGQIGLLGVVTSCISIYDDFAK